ncbi:MAG: hypothetical protein OHK0039_47710 [Bacteroidia bacterium]
MDNVQLIKDPAGNIMEIRVDVQDQPELASEIYNLVRAVQRAHHTERARKFKRVRRVGASATGRMSAATFNKLLRESQASGEISEEAFFQLHPAWRRSEKSSLPS